MDISRLSRRWTDFRSQLGSVPRSEVRSLLAVVLCLALLVVVTAPVLAGPGGQFAKTIAKTWPGKIALAILCFVLLPLVLYVWIREALEVRKTRRDLAELARTRDHFDWAHIEARVEEAAAAIGRVWGSGDLGVAGDYLTESYRGSQQALLDRWRLEGKKNVHEFHDINKIKPLYVRAGGGWWPDQVSVAISATVVDYLQDVETGKILKGKKKRDTDYRTVWHLEREDGAWRVQSIGEGSDSLNVALQKNRLEPTVHEGVGWPMRPSQLPATQVAEDFPPAQEEEGAVEVAEGDDRDGYPGQVAQRRQQQR